MENVKISIIMPVHNGENYLRPAMESIFGQTLSNFEFIIINDGSTDNTEKVINSYKDRRVILLNNKERIGVSKSLNRAVEISRGEYIARMDADDISLPKRLEKQFIFLENHKEIGVLGSNAYLINSEGKEIGKYIRPDSLVLIKWTALFSNPMIHPSIMARTLILKENKYDERLKNGQDYELWSRLIFTKNISFVNLNEPLLKYRIHTESVTQTAILENNKKGSLQISANNLNYLKLIPEEKKSGYLQIISGPKLTIKNIYYLFKIINKLQEKFIEKENLPPNEINSIKKNNYKRYFSIIKIYCKQKIKKIIELTKLKGI